jgi:hypothetical protein
MSIFLWMLLQRNGLQQFFTKWDELAGTGKNCRIFNVMADGRATYSDGVIDILTKVGEDVRCVSGEKFREHHGDRGWDQVLYLARRGTPLPLWELAKAAGLNQHASVRCR